MAQQRQALTAENADDDLAVADAGPMLPTSIMATSAPAGFEDLLEPMSVVVDVYYGGMMIATTSGVQEPGRFTFDDPASVLELIPSIMDRALVVEALSGRLNAHAELVCGSAPRPGCGELMPPVAGVIHDGMRFRVDIFISSELLEVRQVVDDPWLSLPDADFSLISNFAGSVRGVEGRDTNYAIQNRSILAWRNARLAAEVAQSSYYGFETQLLAAELDAGGLRYTGGLFWSSPLSFTGQTRVYGASISSQFDTMAGGEAAYTQPLVVFLMRRAQVNAYRDGRLVGSGLYDPGNQTLDTSQFPAGAYNVTLEIIEDNGARREEVHFFTKDRSLPPPGRTGFSLTAGVLARDVRSALPEMSDMAFIQGTVSHRLTPNIAVDGGALLLGSDFVGEAGTTYLGDGHRARIAGLIGTDGNYGLIAEFSWFDLKTFSANAYVRRTWGPGLGGYGVQDRFGITPVNSVNFLVGDSRQVGGNIGLRLGDVNLRLNGFYNQLARQQSYYAYGPSLDYSWREGRSTQLTLFADGRKSSEGWDTRIGIRVNFNQPDFAVFGELGGAYRKIGNVEQSDVVGSVLATYSNAGIMESDLSVAAGYSHDLDRERVRGEVTLDGQYGRIAGQVQHGFGARDGGTRYSANFATSLALGGGAVTLGGREIGESGIMVSLEGGNPDLQVDVVVDDAPRARIRPGQSVPIFLPSYRTYAVRLAPVSGASGRFDTSVREVTLYAGNMAALEWQADFVQAVFGRLVDASGTPIANALLSGGRDFMQSDAHGYFQGEIALGDEFVVRAAGQEICRVEFPASTDGSALHRLGDVQCGR